MCVCTASTKCTSSAFGFHNPLVEGGNSPLLLVMRLLPFLWLFQSSNYYTSHTNPGTRLPGRDQTPDGLQYYEEEGWEQPVL